MICLTFCSTSTRLIYDEEIGWRGFLLSMLEFNKFTHRRASDMMSCEFIAQSTPTIAVCDDFSSDSWMKHSNRVTLSRGSMQPQLIYLVNLIAV